MDDSPPAAARSLLAGGVGPDSESYPWVITRKGTLPACLRTLGRCSRLGERIQLLRQERGLTQEELAHTCGISQNYLSELERGGKSPSWETLVALAHRGFRIKLG